MTRTIDFYFDYLSPYSYFAWLQLGPLCERLDVALRPRPVLFAALLNHWGHKGPAEIPPKRLFVMKNCLRQAARHQWEFRFPKIHPFKPLTALRASLEEVAGSDQGTVVSALWRAAWVDGLDPGSADDLVRVLDDAGLDGARIIARAMKAEAKAALKAATEQAIARGVFGVPTMAIGDELFWGSDQMEDVENFLQGRDPIDQNLFRQMLAHRPGAIRRSPQQPAIESDR